jgi:hypothetical protein
MRTISLALSLVLVTILLFGSTLHNYFLPSQDATAAISPFPNPTVRVPTSWCALAGSQTANNPATTDQILTERNVGATHIYEGGLGTSTIVFGNNLASDNLQTKVIASPRPDGRMQLSDVTTVLHDCREAWRNAGLPGNGLFVINVELFVNSQGQDQPIGGVGGCESFGMGCRVVQDFDDPMRSSIYNGYAFVADRQYTLSVDPNNHDLAHEIGHALALDCSLPNYSNSIFDPDSGITFSGCHNQDRITLMYPTGKDNNGDGLIDNNGFSAIFVGTSALAAEIERVASKIAIIPGIQIIYHCRVGDPYCRQTIEFGTVLSTFATDKIQENTAQIPPYLDLSTIHASMDTSRKTVSFGPEVFGPIPSNASNLQYWTLLNTDNKTNSGANPELLKAVRVPSTNFTGTDLLIRANVNEGKVTGAVWQFQKGRLVQIPSDAFKIELLRQEVHADLNNFMNLSSPCDIKNPCIQPPVIPVDSTVSTTIKNEFAGGASANQPMSIQTISVNPAGFVADKLDDTALEKGVQIKLVSNITSPVDKAGSLQP